MPPISLSQFSSRMPKVTSYTASLNTTRLQIVTETAYTKRHSSYKFALMQLNRLFTKGERHPGNIRKRNFFNVFLNPYKNTLLSCCFSIIRSWSHNLGCGIQFFLEYVNKNVAQFGSLEVTAALSRLGNLGADRALKSRCILTAASPKNRKIITVSSAHFATCPANEYEA